MVRQNQNFGITKIMTPLKKNNFMKTFLRIADYAIVTLKIFVLILFVLNYKSALNKIAMEISFHYMVPFIFYSTIGIFRILKYKKLSLPLIFLEIICNIYFILSVGKAHAFYLILTIISLLIILHLFYRVSIVRKE
jgi:hypothetical protein